MYATGWRPVKYCEKEENMRYQTCSIPYTIICAILLSQRKVIDLGNYPVNCPITIELPCM